MSDTILIDRIKSIGFAFGDDGRKYAVRMLAEDVKRELTAALARAEKAEIDIKWLTSYCTMGERGMLARIGQLEGELTVANARAEKAEARKGTGETK